MVLPTSYLVRARYLVTTVQLLVGGADKASHRAVQLLVNPPEVKLCYGSAI